MKKLATTLPVATVHEAMEGSRYRTVRNNQPNKENINVRIHARKKELFNTICAAHGTTITDYIEECVTLLIRDYLGPKSFAELQKACGEA